MGKSGKRGVVGSSRGRAVTLGRSAPVVRKPGGQAVPLESPSTLVLREPALSPSAHGARVAVRGLVNLGNTCFFNSVLQSLASIPSVVEYLAGSAWPAAPGEYPPFPPVGEGPVTKASRKLFVELCMRPGGAVSPSSLLDEIGKLNSRFRSRAQQDAQELLRLLLDAWDEEEQHRVRVRNERRDLLIGETSASSASASSAAAAASASSVVGVDVAATAAVPNGEMEGDSAKEFAWKKVGGVFPVGWVEEVEQVAGWNESEEGEPVKVESRSNAPRPGPSVNTWVWELFGSRLASVVRCSECNRTSVTVEQAFDLSLPLPRPVLVATRTSRVVVPAKPKKPHAAKLQEAQRAAEAARAKAAAARARLKGEAKSSRAKVPPPQPEKAPAPLSLPKGLEPPPETWLRRASKRELFQWLLDNAPCAYLATKGLFPLRGGVAKASKRFIATEVYQMIGEACRFELPRPPRPKPVDAATQTEDAPVAIEEEAVGELMEELLGQVTEQVELSIIREAAVDCVDRVVSRALEVALVEEVQQLVEDMVHKAISAEASADEATAAAAATAGGAGTPREDNDDDDEPERFSVPTLKAHLPGGFIIPPVPLGKAGSIRGSLAAFCAEDALDALTGNGYHCERCSKEWADLEPGRDASKAPKVNATKRLIILDPPRVLTLHVKRFEISMMGMMRKRSEPMAFASTLDLGPFCALHPAAVEAARAKLEGSSEGPISEEDVLELAMTLGPEMRYSLRGVVEHLGGSLLSGHYVAGVRNEASWFVVSDSNVRTGRRETVTSQQGYLLFYERDS
jgi:ubiquitin C-terminal hydrolase